MEKLISLCMIVKNEATVLKRCLESVKSLVDEIIIVDTGSTDDTKIIAAAYTHLIYDFKWINDFAAARNESIGYATGQWILILDADEYMQVTDPYKLRQFLSSYPSSKPSGFILEITNYMGSGFDETKTSASTGARIFSNNRNIRYIDPIHEQLTSDSGTLSFEPYPLTIFHTGYTEQTVIEKNKSQRNLSILENMNSSQKQNDPYYCFVLGNEYSTAGLQEKALTAYSRSYSKSKPADTWYFHLLDRLITIEIQLGEHAKAHKRLREGIKLKPNFTDFHCMEGILLDSLGLWEAAVNAFNKCIDIAHERESLNEPYWIVQPTYGKIIPHQMLAQIKHKQGDLQSAVHHWIKTLQLQPKNVFVLQQLMGQLLLTETPDHVRSLVERLYPVDRPMNIVLLFKMSLTVGNIPLASHYQNELHARDIKIDYSDTLLASILLKGNLAARPDNQNNKITPALSIAAALISSDINYTNLASKDADTCRGISEQALNVSKYVVGEHEHEKLNKFEELLVQVLQLLFKCGYLEIYMHLLQQMANANVLNDIANWLYQTGYADESIDLYSSLLDNNILSAEGYKQVAQWYINAGNSAEGYEFLRMSFVTQPSLDIIGRIKEKLSETAYTQFYPEFINSYPNLSKCTLL